MRIDQLVPQALPGDPRLDLANHLYSYLSEIDPQTQVLENVDDLDFDAMVVVHTGPASAEVTEALRYTEKIIIDHDQGSAEPYLAFSPERAGRIAATDTHAAMLSDAFCVAIAFSSQRAEVLRQMGYKWVAVCQPVVSIDGVLSAQPHVPTLNHFATQIYGPTIIGMGSLLPTGHQEQLVQAYHVLATHLIPDAHLAIIGETPMQRYQWCVETELNELNLNQAWIAGALTDEQTAAYLENANVYVSASEVADYRSLLLAMASGLPIIAKAAPGLEEFCGDAALVLPVDSGPQFIAEAIAEVLKNDELATSMIYAGADRVARYNTDDASLRLLSLILSMAVGDE